MAPRFVEKDEGFRGEARDGVVKYGPLLLDVWLRLLDGAKRFFCGEGPVSSRPG
jgi:hypothetical protein